MPGIASDQITRADLEPLATRVELATLRAKVDALRAEMKAESRATRWVMAVHSALTLALCARMFGIL